MLPRYFLLLSELEQIDSVITWELDNIKEQHPSLVYILNLLNQKLDLINTTQLESLQSILPQPKEVNISETGISFHSETMLKSGSFLHLSLSQPNNSFHIAATVNVVYCAEKDEDGFRIGAHFVSIHSKDRNKLAEVLT